MRLVIHNILIGALVFAAGAGGDAPPTESVCPLLEAGAPRVLLLALDGTPLRTIQRAKEEGLFEGWPEPVGLISTFPSMSNVAFTAMLEPLGFPPTIAGYEIRRYEYDQNRLWGGKTKGSLFAWKSEFDVYSDTIPSKVDLYLTPVKSTDKLLAEIEDLLLGDIEPRVAFAHLPATDMTSHLDGDDATLAVLAKVDAMLTRLIPAHRERHGRDLQVILLSDHGNGSETVWNTHGLRDALRSAGFRFTKRLENRGDLVAPLYGAVNYGALYLDPDRAREAAEAALAHESVDLAAWLSGPGALKVLDAQGHVGLVRWAGEPTDRRYTYDALRGDPLRYSPVAARLRVEGAFDAGGLAARNDWFEASLEGEYPDALARLVDALDGRWVENPATVILSLGPRYAWGLLPTRIGAGLLGGLQEGTHGGLDRESSLAFLLVNDTKLQPTTAVPADLALEQWAPLRACVDAAREQRVAEEESSLGYVD